MPLALSVIIVSYNTREDLRACLAALTLSDVPRETLETIVVDNASSDGSAAMVRDEFPDVRLIEPGRNTWFCGGNNLGLDHATGEYALLLNPDTVPPPDALPAMLNFIRAHPDYAGVTMALRYPDGKIQRTCSRVPSYAYLLFAHAPLLWLWRGRKRDLEAHHWMDEWARDRDADVETVPGSCTLMRRAELRLDENLRLYFPEDDLAARIQVETPGRTFRFLAQPGIIHREKSATRSALAGRIYFDDLMIFTRKHHGWAKMALLWGLSRPLAWGIALRWRFRRAS